MAPSRNDAAPGRQRDDRDGHHNDARREADMGHSNQRHPPAAAPRRTNPRRSYTDPTDGPSIESYPPPSTRRSLADSSAWQNYERHELQPIPSRAPMEEDPRQQTSVRASGRDGSPAGSTDRKAATSYRITSSMPGATYAKGQGMTRNIRKVSLKDRASAQLAAFYQAFIIEGLLRRFPLPPTKDGRHIPLSPSSVGPGGLIDERSNKPYIDNFIRSSRYTVYDFVPKQLVFQFSKLGNFYFLVMGILQMIPGLSTVGRYTTVVPLSIFVAFSMAKEGYDDYRRYQLDKAENRSKTWVLSHGVRRTQQPASGAKGRSSAARKRNAADSVVASPDLESRGMADWVPVQWQQVQVGDVVRLQRDQAVPADMALLHATGPNGIAYIETMALDGETNLKSKQACTLLVERCNTVEGIKSTQATVVSEDPNLDLYSYDGKVTVDGETLPLSLNNVVYRGSTLRNTAEAIGLVINSGEECKIRMNANKNARAKAPAMQSIINKMVLFQITIVLTLAGGLTAGYSLWRTRVEDISPYLVHRPLFDASVPMRNIFFGYMIMFNTLIPLSLYISMEIIKIGQLLLMDDVDMYDPVTDTPMVANTTTILENLGQVSYVFSDKTGTLTENMMRFRKLSVAGVACLHDMDVQRDEEAMRRKLEAQRRHSKGKERALHTKRMDDEDEITDNGNDFHKRHAPARQNSVGSTSHWKSTVRPDEEPEMKTEELLEYIRQKPNTTFSRKAKHLLLCIALCHTCLPEAKENGEIAFQAASPDELALVEAARDLGIMLVDRPAQSIKLQTRAADGSLQTETYQVLDVIEFSSKRKRMSIIIRMPDGRLCIFCKGADNVIMSRLKLSHLAELKANDIGRRASVRKTFEQDMAMRRMSEHASARATPRTSFALKRADSTDRLKDGLRLSLGRRSTDMSAEALGSWINRRQTEEMASPRTSADFSRNPRQRLSQARSFDDVDHRIDESVAANEAAVFENCFQHIDDFASEGLRTLLYAYRYIDDDSYAKWKELYREAETSLVDRQERIEEAGDLIEQKLELAGATAIEDKLQDGVPETIDKLRRANVKVWMLTGDKRETAINIGHSARLCKPFSEIYILDATRGGLQDTMTATLNDVGRGMVPHSVLVVDGQTLAIIDADDSLALLFNDLVVRVDSVICCRASPSQKANLVKSIRRHVPKSMTLAIGDGANDIGMIQASHVGIGISGREGLQAARISDYSIAQFRFLQKLLFVHGRWNYLRTGKYVLATFWKEILFFLVQAHYQRMNGFSGTSLFESWSLTVFNSAFTSLPVLLLGIFEKDLSADTLLAVPELYTFGQQGRGFNYVQYLGWMVMGVSGSFIIFYTMCGAYVMNLFSVDTSLFAMGDICFTAAVIFINVKLLILEMHSKTVITFVGFFVSVAGWFLWNIFLSAVYKGSVGPYIVRHAFLLNFGRKLQWWATMFVGLAMLVVLELVVQGVRRVYWPTDQDLMQRIERDIGVGRSITHLTTKDGNDEKDIEMQNLVAERGREDATKQETSRASSRSSPSSRLSYEQERRPRVSHDDYRRPRFASPAEEREGPFDGRKRHQGGSRGWF